MLYFPFSISYPHPQPQSNLSRSSPSWLKVIIMGGWVAPCIILLAPGTGGTLYFSFPIPIPSLHFLSPSPVPNPSPKSQSPIPVPVPVAWQYKDPPYLKVQVGWRSGEGQKSQISTWALHFTIFLIFTLQPPTRNFFFGFISVYTCHMDSGTHSITQVWSKMVTISRWTTRWT